MHLAIVANHSFPHIGGTEKVILEIAERLTRLHSYKVSVFSLSLSQKMTHNEVEYIPGVKNPHHFWRQVSDISPDHVFIYSDYFDYWPDLLQQENLIKCGKTISLVGMNRMLSHPHLITMLKNKKEHFNVITHSDNYQDYKTCKSIGIDPVVIHNGVDADEFVTNFDFKAKYDIKSPIILCVSNFFPGKGQEYLVDILSQLHQDSDVEFTAVFISSKVNFQLSKVLSSQCQKKLSNVKYNWKFLTDIPREEVVAAFAHASVFAFPSQQEVAPIVLLEAEASFTPWVALPVGNAETLSGGVVCIPSGEDRSGKLLYNKETMTIFAYELQRILADSFYRSCIIDKAYLEAVIGLDYNWDHIVDKYDQLFKGEQDVSKS